METDRRLLDATNNLVKLVDSIIEKNDDDFSLSTTDIINKCGGFVDYKEIMTSVDIALHLGWYVKYVWENDSFLFINKTKKEEPVKKVTCEKVGDWTASLNREAYEKDPATVKLLSHRYHLESICGTHYSIWDSKEKELFEIKGEKKWEKWKAEHKDEWCTDF